MDLFEKFFQFGLWMSQDPQHKTEEHYIRDISVFFFLTAKVTLYGGIEGVYVLMRI